MSCFNSRIAACVVTYNRKELLIQCLTALDKQTHSIDKIFVIDNASTDGTKDALNSSGWLTRSDFQLISLPDNTGGAGGFQTGVETATSQNFDWTWVMDDDAIPHSEALSRLLEVIDSSSDIYGSLAVNGRRVSWPTKLLDMGIDTELVSDIPVAARVSFLPFLGMLIPKAIVKEIGLPDAGFFIAADDVEYCMRAQRAGHAVIVAGNSWIEHPRADRYKIRLLWVSINCLRLAPWKRYYDTRNKLIIAHKYYGAALWYKTIPGSFARLLGTLIREPQRMAQLHAFFTGMYDGLLGRKGRRHEIWGIR